MSSLTKFCRIQGPIFISIGDEEKLQLFLTKNPRIPRENMFVDGLNFSSYTAIGFGRIGGNVDKSVKAASKLQIPRFTPKRWLDYIRSVAKLSPIRAEKIQFPAGVTVLGGTFGISGEDILFSHEDMLPGDHPVPREVIKVLLGIRKSTTASQ